MLKELRVRNFAIVEDGRLALGPGMTCFTGETGAGKSLLFDAVTLLLGGKARSHLVRTGAASAEVEGVFDLSKDAPKRKLASELGFEVDDDDGGLLLVRREISGGDTARNRVWIQGKSATRQQLQALLGDWVEVSGQHEFLRLGRDEYILALVDQFGGLRDEVRNFGDRFELHRVHVEELEAARAEEAHRVSRMDYLRFQVEEMEKAGVSPDAALEEERLIALRVKLGNLDRLQRSLNAVRSCLEGNDGGEDESSGALQRLQGALRELRPLQDFGPEFRELLEGLEAAESALSDHAIKVNRLLGSLEADPESLEHAESRLSLLTRLKRKYGKEIPELVQLLSEAKVELARFENFDERLSELLARCEKSRQALHEAAMRLHKRRSEAAAALAKSWERDIRSLGMKQARLSLEVEALEEFRATGLTRVEALFSANSGESLRPLGKVASGGELSRILLALKHIVAGRSEIGVYLFDEVDSGIGGETAHAVASRLRGIAGDNQVIVVTHLAQIAASSHHQFRIRKVTEKGKTRTLLETLTPDDRTAEIARMLGDTSSSTALKLARELLEKANGAGSAPAKRKPAVREMRRPSPSRSRAGGL